MKPNISDLVTWFPLKHQIERFYPFTFNELKELESILDFSNISYNSKITWNVEILNEFSHKFSWSQLSSNQSIPWTPDLVSKFENYFHWHFAAQNTTFPWTKELFFRYKDLFDWETLGDLPVKLRDSEICFLSKEQIKSLARFENVEWDICLLERFKDHLDWEYICGNPAMPYSEFFFKSYKNKFYYVQLLSNPWLLKDQNLPLMEKIAFIEYDNLSLYKEDWTEEFIHEHKDLLNWEYLSSNENLPWSKEFLQKYEDRWNWGLMSGNKNVPWTWELIEKYEEEWNWRDDEDPYASLFQTLSTNPSLPWSQKFVDRYSHRLTFGSVDQLDENEFTITFGISSNTKIDWDLDFLLKYKDRWDVESLRINEAVYPLIDRLVSKDKMLEFLKYFCIF